MSALLGRSHEMAALHRLTVRSRPDGAALMLIGEAGIGKSALLDEAAERASSQGLRVLRAGHGQPRSAPAPFGVLEELIAPLRNDTSRISPAHRVALDVAVRATPGDTPSRSVLAGAVLALLAARDEPALIIADDLQWIDPASAGVLSLLTRRLGDANAALLVASRPDVPSVFDHINMVRLVVGPLGTEDARTLLGWHYPALSHPVRERVLVEARGNPLALLELPRELSPSQQAGHAPLPRPFMVTTEVADLFGARLAAMPPATRRVLLLLALDGTQDLSLLPDTSEDVLEALVPAEHAGLVRVGEDFRSARFRHPLVQSSIVTLADDSERREAHHLLAQALHQAPGQRAWHLAEAASGHDGRVAELLEHEAERTLRRGDPATAATYLLRAAGLSATPNERARRQVHAAFLGADATGDLKGARALLAEAQRSEPDLTMSLPATLVASAMLLNAEGDVGRAHRLLTEAIHHHPSRSPQDGLLGEALHTLLLMSWFAGQPDSWHPFLKALKEMGPDVPELLDIVHATFGDPAARALGAVARLERVVEETATEEDAFTVLRVGMACAYVDRLGSMRPALRRVLIEAQDSGAIVMALHATVSCTIDAWQSGEWDEALVLADQGVRLCQEHGYDRYAVMLGSYLGHLVGAARGNTQAANEAAEDLVAWASSRSAGTATLFAQHVRCLAAIATGDYEAAFAHAVSVSKPGELAAYNPQSLWLLFELVESAVRTGRRAEAAAHVNVMRQRRLADLSPRLNMVSAGCAGLLATMDARADDVTDGAEASEWFARALAVPGGQQWPFDRARIQLAYGEHLRSHGLVPAAREQLLAALDNFRMLGCTPWATRASDLLRATGLAPTLTVVDHRPLTDRERDVALLAAQGLTNREIGAQLFLSPRSVGSILYRVFPKLGVTSRAALSAALELHADVEAGGSARAKPETA